MTDITPLLIIFALITLDVLALRFGTDSQRVDTRERPRRSL